MSYANYAVSNKRTKTTFGLKITIKKNKKIMIFLDWTMKRVILSCSFIRIFLQFSFIKVILFYFMFLLIHLNFFSFFHFLLIFCAVPRKSKFNFYLFPSLIYLFIIFFPFAQVFEDLEGNGIFGNFASEF